MGAYRKKRKRASATIQNSDNSNRGVSFDVIAGINLEALDT